MEKESMETKEEEGCSAGETAGKYRTMTMRKKYTLAIAILGILWIPLIIAEERQEGREEKKQWEAEIEETNNRNGEERGGEIYFANGTFLYDKFNINKITLITFCYYFHLQKNPAMDR